MKDVNILIPRSCEHGKLHGKRDFSDMTELKILRRGHDLGPSWQAHCNHRGCYKRETGESESEKETWPQK